MRKNLKVVNEFKDFLKEYKVISVAVAFIMGQAINDLIKSFVNDILMPLLNPIVSSGDWQQATLKFGSISINFGSFAGTTLRFLILSLIIFVIVKKIIEKK